MRGVVFLSLFGIGVLAALFNPFWGLLAYLGHYYVWPENQWWGQLLESAGLRVSLTIAVVTIGSTAFHWGNLTARVPGVKLHPQQTLLIAFVAFMGLTKLYGVEPDPKYAVGVLPFDKMWKVTLFLLVLTHVVTSARDYQRLMWFVFAVGGVYLGWEAHHAPMGSFKDGRLDSLGGPDFQTANFLSIHFLAMGIVGAALLASSASLRQRLAALLGGGLVANGFLLARSRGGFLAMGTAGIAAIALAEPRLRKQLLRLLPVLAVGVFLLMDAAFLKRMTTITADESERDYSAQERLDLWQIGLQMFADHPLGVGCGNFSSEVGRYSPMHAGRDPHSSYIRCLVELGVVGIGFLCLLNVSAFRISLRSARLAQLLGRWDMCSFVLANQLILIAYAIGGLTGTFVYNEAYYVYLLLPVCVERSLMNENPALPCGATA